MEILRWKTRIALLWFLMAVAMSAHSGLFLMEPDGLERLAEEAAAMGAGMLVFMALLWLVPLWLAFMCLTVKGPANRWVNLILGIIFTILNIVHFVEHLAPPSPAQILIVGSTVVATALIAWYAWKWPKQEA
jgi:hypothetical protein